MEYPDINEIYPIKHWLTQINFDRKHTKCQVEPSSLRADNKWQLVRLCAEP